MKKRITTFLLFWFLIAFMAILLLSGCKAKESIRYVEIPKITTKIDSILIQRTDSFIQFVKNDTIYQSRWKTVFRDRVKIEKDTVSIPVKVLVDVPIEVEILRYRWFSYFDILVMGLVLFSFGFFMWKRLS